MVQVSNKAVDAASAERRRAPRHRLCLDAEAQTLEGSISPVVLHELSRTGFLMETAAPFGVGEIVQLRLPEEDRIAARVVWSCGRHFGCEFQRALQTAAISAALLKARHAREGEGIPQRLRPTAVAEEARVATNAASPLGRQLPLILGLSAVLWGAVLAAFLIL